MVGVACVGDTSLRAWASQLAPVHVSSWLNATKAPTAAALTASPTTRLIVRSTSGRCFPALINARKRFIRQASYHTGVRATLRRGKDYVISPAPPSPRVA